METKNLHKAAMKILSSDSGINWSPTLNLTFSRLWNPLVPDLKSYWSLLILAPSHPLLWGQLVPNS